MIDEELRAILACPACKGVELIFEETRIICPRLPQGLPDPRRHSRDADQRGGALGARRDNRGHPRRAARAPGSGR